LTSGKLRILNGEEKGIISAININRNLPFASTGIRIFHKFNYKPGIKLIATGSDVITTGSYVITTGSYVIL
jgi:hypothetical protein